MTFFFFQKTFWSRLGAYTPLGGLISSFFLIFGFFVGFFIFEKIKLFFLFPPYFSCVSFHFFLCFFFSFSFFLFFFFQEWRGGEGEAASRALRLVATSTNQSFRACKVNLAIPNVAKKKKRKRKKEKVFFSKKSVKIFFLKK